MCPPLSVPPTLVKVFSRRGEKILVEEFSYKGYSPPKCICNGKHTHIQVKICTFILKCLHAMHHVSSPHSNSLTHAFSMYEKLVSKQKIFVFENSLDNLPYQNPLDNPSKINSLDKPPIRFVGQPSAKIYWVTLR